VFTVSPIFRDFVRTPPTDTILKVLVMIQQRIKPTWDKKLASNDFVLRPLSVGLGAKPRRWAQLTRDIRKGIKRI